jgi:hypothetical protein
MFARKLRKQELANSDDVIFVPIDGFSSWTRLDAMKWAFEQSLGESIDFCVVLDRDYRCDEETDAIIAELKSHIQLVHVHCRKEIENYLLVPTALRRLITELSDEPEILDDVINTVSEEVVDATSAQYAARHAEFSQKMGIDQATSIAEANRRFRTKWSEIDLRMEIVPGKQFLSAMNRQIQNKANRTLTPSSILSAMRQDEVPTDMIELIDCLEAFRTGKRPHS